MNTNTMELNMNEMGAVSGGVDWDYVASQFDWKDAVGVVLFGPVGEVRAFGKFLAALVKDDD